MIGPGALNIRSPKNIYIPFLLPIPRYMIGPGALKNRSPENIYIPFLLRIADT